MTARHEKSIFFATIAGLATLMVVPRLTLPLAPRPMHAVAAGFVAAGVAAYVAGRRAWKQGQPLAWWLEGRCRDCGYDLYGLTGDQCPECGRPFDERDRLVARSATGEDACEAIDDRRRRFAFVMGLVSVAGGCVVPTALISIVPAASKIPVGIAAALACFGGFAAALVLSFLPARAAASQTPRSR